MPQISAQGREAIAAVLAAPTDRFDELARVAGLRPERDFRHIVLRHADFGGSNLAGFDFTGTRFERCKFAGASIGTAIFADASFEGCDEQPGAMK